LQLTIVARLMAESPASIGADSVKLPALHRTSLGTQIRGSRSCETEGYEIADMLDRRDSPGPVIPVDWVENGVIVGAPCGPGGVIRGKCTGAVGQRLHLQRNKDDPQYSSDGSLMGDTIKDHHEGNICWEEVIRNPESEAADILAVQPIDCQPYDRKRIATCATALHGSPWIIREATLLTAQVQREASCRCTRVRHLTFRVNRPSIYKEIA
jgi:hypothetical protein